MGGSMHRRGAYLDTSGTASLNRDAVPVLLAGKV